MTTVSEQPLFEFVIIFTTKYTRASYIVFYLVYLTVLFFYFRHRPIYSSPTVMIFPLILAK